MSGVEGQGAEGAGAVRSGPRRLVPTYAALDLGTNNCRLLIAAPTSRGFRILESFSRIVRLGEGLTRTGRLDAGAKARTLAALRICADKIARRAVLRVRAVATQACRQAQDGDAFIADAAAETGVALEIISPREEARLSVMGCLNLLDHDASAALVVDVGGGSTELSWVDLRDGALRRHVGPCAPHRLPIRAWLSIPVGVVTLAERFPEPFPASQAWFEEMVAHVRGHIAGFRHAEHLRPVFAAKRAHMIGSSGAITSLAGLHLGLERYERARVDGLWMTREDCGAAAARLMRLDPAGRAGSPCIGPDRADLVLAGAAILQAVQALWPCERVRVADRGLREGILLSMMSQDRSRRPPCGPPVAAARAASPALSP